MSVGMGGLFASAAGVPFAQINSSDSDRGRIESSAQQRLTKSELKAEAAAGIGATDGQDHEAEERDADGRRPWEIGGQHRQPPDADAASDSKGAEDARGHGLDLTA